MWMKNHKDIINKFRPCPAGLKTFENVSEGEAHKIQYHSVNKEMWVSEAKVSSARSSGCARSADGIMLQ